MKCVKINNDKFVNPSKKNNILVTMTKKVNNVSEITE